MTVRVGLGYRDNIELCKKSYFIFIVPLKELNPLQVNKIQVVKLKLSIRLHLSLIKKMLFL